MRQYFVDKGEYGIDHNLPLEEVIGALEIAKLTLFLTSADNARLEGWKRIFK